MAQTTFKGPVKSDNGFIFGTGDKLTSVLLGSATLDFGSVAAGLSADLTITVTGAALGDVVALGTPNVAAGAGFHAFVSAADTVTVRVINNTAGALDLASGTYNVLVFQSAAV